MSYSDAEISESATYKLLLKSSGEIPDSSTTVEITVSPGEGTWTQAGTDALFQQLLDLLDGASFLAPVSGGQLVGRKHQAVNTVATATVLDESPGEPDVSP